MADGHHEPGDRWKQLIASMDPERNLRAAASLFSQAASASERLVGSISDSTVGDVPASGLRDVRAELERAFDRFAAAAKRLVFELPFGTAGVDSPAGGATIAVLDGVGTTVVEIPGAGAEVRAGQLLRHDGAVLEPGVVTVVRSITADSEHPTFVVRVDVPAGTPPGTYHGQLVTSGRPDQALALKVTVVGDTV